MRGGRQMLMGLGLVFALLIVALIVQQSSSSGGDEGAQAEPTAQLQRVFDDLAVLDILALRIEDPITRQNFTIFRQEDGTWAAQGAAEGQPRTLQEGAGTLLARSVVLMSYIQTVSPPEDDLAAFGFRGGAQLSIYLVTTTGEHAFAVGDALQTGPHFYVLVDDRPEIYVVDRAAIDTLAAALMNPPISAE